MTKVLFGVAAAAVIALAAGPALAFTCSEFCVFGNNSATLYSEVYISGRVGSNNNVTVFSASEVLMGMTGGGQLTANSGVESGGAGGDVTFDGNVTIFSGALIDGNVNSGGSATVYSNAHITGDLKASQNGTLFSGAVVDGNMDVGSSGAGNATLYSGAQVGNNLTAKGDVTMFSNSEVVGNVLADNNFTAQSDAHVGGDAAANGNVTLFSNVHVDGSVMYGTGKTYTEYSGVVIGNPPPTQGAVVVNPATPDPFVPVVCPSPGAVTPGATNLTKFSGDPSPDLPNGTSLNNVTLYANQTLHLHGGAAAYQFNTLTAYSGLDLYLDDVSAATPITVLVKGNATFYDNVKVFINGVAYDPTDAAQRALAANVHWESEDGSYAVFSNSQWFGNVLTDKAITYYSGCNVTGQLHAEDVTLFSRTRVNCAGGDPPIPPGGQGLITGMKWFDLDQSGTFDPATEAGLEGWGIHLKADLAGADIDFTTTGPGGFYSFGGLEDGTYYVLEDLLPGWTQTCPLPDGYYTVVLSAGGAALNQDFGNYTAAMAEPGALALFGVAAIGLAGRKRRK